MPLARTSADAHASGTCGASLLVIGFGIFRLVNRRHPRVLARIRPTQLGLWSFAVAIAHGAGLMLVPIYLGLCRAAELAGCRRERHLPRGKPGNGMAARRFSRLIERSSHALVMALWPPALYARVRW